MNSKFSNSFPWSLLLFIIVPIDSNFSFWSLIHEVLNLENSYDFSLRNITQVYLEKSSTTIMMYFLPPILKVCIIPIRFINVLLWKDAGSSYVDSYCAYLTNKEHAHVHIDKGRKTFDSLEARNFIQGLVVNMPSMLMPNLFYVET